MIVLLLALMVGQPQTDEVRLVNNLLNARTKQCWTLDRLSNKDIVSCAATGVGFYGYAVAAQQGMISRNTASHWIKTGFDNMLLANTGNDGWLYHFLSCKTGKPSLTSEVSTIDSTIFYASAEQAARLLDDKNLVQHILACKGKVRLDVVRDSGGYICHGFTYRANFIREYLPWSWRNYNEGILIYKYFGLPFKPVKIDYSLPLFCFYYPLAYYPGETSWQNHLGKAIDFQLDNAGRYGYSAMDTESGYAVNSPFYVSPLAVLCTRKFFPLKAATQIKQFNVDSLEQSMSVNERWKSSDRVLLDDGILLILLNTGAKND